MEFSNNDSYIVSLGSILLEIGLKLWALIKILNDQSLPIFHLEVLIGLSTASHIAKAIIPIVPFRSTP